MVTVSLTKAGQRVIDRYMPEHVAQITEALGVLPPDEQDVLGELCKRLGLGNAGDG